MDVIQRLLAESSAYARACWAVRRPDQIATLIRIHLRGGTTVGRVVSIPGGVWVRAAKLV